VLMPDGIHHPRLGEFNAQAQITIFDRLNEANRTWKVYFYDFPISLLLNNQRRAENLARYSLIRNFFRDVQDEKYFPSFAFIEPKYLGPDQNDDHPPHNVFKAEKLIADVYNAIRSNEELWESTLLVVTYDEHGGFYDHVEPPSAAPPDNLRGDSPFGFDRYGVRVPALLISPWVEARVEKTLFDHTSLLKYLTNKWSLGELGARTAAANSIGTALRSEKRSGVLPFIRVPYTNLIPEKPDLEKGDMSRHHKAIHAFALFLATEKGAVLGTLIEAIAREAGLWLRLRAWVGSLFQRVSRWLTKSLDHQRVQRVWATNRVAVDQISDAQIEVAANASSLGSDLQ
jgi:phospholipase C